MATPNNIDNSNENNNNNNNGMSKSSCNLLNKQWEKACQFFCLIFAIDNWSLSFLEGFEVPCVRKWNYLSFSDVSQLMSHSSRCCCCCCCCCCQKCIFNKWIYSSQMIINKNSMLIWMRYLVKVRLIVKLFWLQSQRTDLI